jgi:hypothetical protein
MSAGGTMAAAQSSLKSNARKRTKLFDKGYQKYSESWKGRNTVRKMTPKQRLYWAQKQREFQRESRKRITKIVVVTVSVTSLLLLGGYGILSILF